jgi:uncharacterized protein YbjQ (UPF0145 family)
MDKCPNCNREIKSSMMSKVQLLDEKKIGVINLYNEVQKNAYCNKCGNSLFEEAKEKWVKERQRLYKEIRDNLNIVPAVSTHSPLNWDYDIIDIVTGQATMGTGFFTEWNSGWADIWGTDSKFHNDKIKKAEKLSFDQVKKQALDLGGNALIATDIDYAEVGGVKGMIMVCITGTAIRLKNFEILGQERQKNFEKLSEKYSRMVKISQYK